MENLFKISKQILWEIEKNPNIQERWKVWMKIAVGYIIDEIYNNLFNSRLEEKLEWDWNEIETEFETEIWYDKNDTLEKQLEKLHNYFTSLKKNWNGRN